MGAKKTGKKAYRRYKIGDPDFYYYRRAKENATAHKQADAIHEGHVIMSSKSPFVRNQPFVSGIEPLDDDTDLPEHYYYEYD